MLMNSVLKSMSRNYKNNVLHDHISIGKDRREALIQEPLSDSTPFPDTLEYEDIDRAFRKWVEEDLKISFEGENLPTMVLYSNQRFSEYKQSWEFNDDKHNLVLNFKTISRETNPKQGELYGQVRNIPGDRYYTMKRVLCQDDAGRKYFTVYKMKQPFTVNLVYKVGIITNKIELINQFNQIMNDKFKSITAYIRPNGHYIPMKLEDISDDSELSLNDREFYSQSYGIKVLAYIIDKTSFRVDEEPFLKLNGVDTQMNSNRKSSVDIEEYDGNETCVTAKFVKDGETKAKFTMDCNIYVTGMTCENINSFGITINDNPINLYVVDGKVSTSVKYTDDGLIANEKFEKFTISENDEIRIKKVEMGSNEGIGLIKINGILF